MSIETVLTIVGAIGGVEGIKWGISSWMNRKTDARKEDAAADSMEIHNLLDIIAAQGAQIENVYSLLKGRDGKVDFLYTELRKSEEKVLDLTRGTHELEMLLKDAEYNRCDKPESDCGKGMQARKKIGNK